MNNNNQLHKHNATPCLACDGDHPHVADLIGAADEQVQLGPAAVFFRLPGPGPGRGGQQQRTEQRGRARQRNLLQRLQRQQVVDLHQGRARRQQRHCGQEHGESNQPTSMD